MHIVWMLLAMAFERLHPRGMSNAMLNSCLSLIVPFALSSRLGVVYVPRRCVPPCAAFRTWLDSPVLGELLGGIGVSRGNIIRARLSELAQKLMWPTLAYMAGRGDAVFREEVVTLQVGKGTR